METSSSHRGGLAALYVLHYTLPLSIFVYYSVASLISVCVQRKEAEKTTSRDVLWKTVFGLMISVLLTYFAEATTLLVASFVSDEKSFSKDNLICLVLSNLAWFVLAAGIADSPPPIRYPFTGSWIIAFALETAILILTVLFESPSQSIKYTRLSFQIVRLCGLFVLTGIALSLLVPIHLRSKLQPATSEETQPLLTSSRSEYSQNQAAGEDYGSVDPEPQPSNENGDVEKDADDKNAEDDDDEEENLKVQGNWWTYAKTFSIYIPIVWPKSSICNQLRLLGCGLCLVAARALNILRPRQYGIVINSLADGENAKSWIQSIALLAFYSLLISASGVPLLKSYLWLPVEKDMTAKLSKKAYNHVMNLSSDFHDSKRSGPLWYSIYNAHSVTDMLELVFFDVLPVIFDLFLASAYIYFKFDPYLALIVFGTAIIYLWSSTAIIARQTAQRRKNREIWKSERAILTETTSNWRTVSYFNRIPHEQDRYASAVKDGTAASILLSLWYYFEYAIKACIMELALFLILIIAGYHVVHGAPIGNIVTLMQFWNQITYPLAVIARSFTNVVNTMVDAEDLLKVLKKEPSIQDDEDAKPLVLEQGEVEFESVNFSYDKKRDILKDVSFRATPGQTIALVGETGGGKSTVLKLLFRFYDVTSGSIKIDGQDIRKITIASLRRIIGNVPQDATLFNDTVMNNVRYAKIDASEEEVHEACKAAAIHEKVLSFSKGYQTKVGEGGTKLSGGELQRLAIARAILQDPQIVLLDEATSSVDTETESHIQESLKRLTSGRTTFVIAHRLSTILNADLILVIRKGEIVERGTHLKLMKIGGQYHNLWTKQMVPNAERNAERNPEGRTNRESGSDYLNDLGSDFDGEKFKKSARDSGDMDDEEVATAMDESSQDKVAFKKEKEKAQEMNKDGKEKGDGSKKKRFWRPDAPEFVPQTMRESTKKDSAGPSDNASKKERGEGVSGRVDGDEWEDVQESPSKGKGKQKASYEQDTAGESCQKHSDTRDDRTHKHGHHHHHHHDRPGLSKRKTTQGSEAQNDGAGGSGGNDGTDSEMLSKAASTTEEAAQDTPKPKKRRFNRRNQSKSEPAGQGQTDGTDDAVFTPDGSGEGQSTSIMGNRRVSAPSDPQPRPVEAGTSANPQRRRRRRQWRKRNPNNSHSTSTIVTTGSSSMTSPEFNTPNAPPTSPAQGTTVAELMPTGNVRFAREA